MRPGAGRQMDAREDRNGRIGGGSRLLPPIMATYNKDYSHKTAEEWLVERKWTGFLMRVPLRASKSYKVMNANDAMSIRTTASALTNNPECDRTFQVTINFGGNEVVVTANKKK